MILTRKTSMGDLLPVHSPPETTKAGANYDGNPAVRRSV